MKRSHAVCVCLSFVFTFALRRRSLRPLRISRRPSIRPMDRRFPGLAEDLAHRLQIGGFGVVSALRNQATGDTSFEGKCARGLALPAGQRPYLDLCATHGASRGHRAFRESRRPARSRQWLRDRHRQPASQLGRCALRGPAGDLREIRLAARDRAGRRAAQLRGDPLVHLRLCASREVHRNSASGSVLAALRADRRSSPMDGTPTSAAAARKPERCTRCSIHLFPRTSDSV